MLSPFRDEPTLQLAQICSGWRKVALRTPQLWTDVTIRWSGSTFDVYKSIIETWFYRATPLSLSLHIPRRPPLDKAGETERDVIRLLCNHANRLREFSFALPQPIVDRLLVLPAGSMKMLESVSVFTNDEITSPNDSDTNDDPMWDNYDQMAFQDAPSLRCLTLGGRWGGLSIIKNLNIPWHNLTDLTFSGTIPFYVNPFLDVLQRCKALINCRFLVGGGQDCFWLMGSVRVLAMSQLRSLQLVRSMDFHRTLFQDLTFPFLENLEFESESTNSDYTFS